jgi:CubicO group peptidase (beta-lactamase class C family)
MKLALFAAALLAQGPPDSRSLSARVDELVARHVKPDGPGCAVLVLRQGRVLHKKHHVPVTPQTSFELASVSKQFTAVAVLILMERGRLTLDDDVRKHLPELEPYDPSRPVRIRDLLRHVSGLPEYLRDVFTYKGDPLKLTNADVPKLLAGKKLDFPTGSKWKYCNTNYALLALVVERVSGKKFSAFLTEEIFQPLGMTATRVLDDHGLIIPHRAAAYSTTRLRGLILDEWDVLIVGDGGVRTSLDDFARWDDALRTGKLLKPETWKLAFTPGKLDSGKPHQYGCGWGIGPDFYDHAGAWAGFRCYAIRFPADGLSVVVLANDAAFPAARVAHQVVELHRPKDAAGGAK